MNQGSLGLNSNFKVAGQGWAMMGVFYEPKATPEDLVIGKACGPSWETTTEPQERAQKCRLGIDRLSLVPCANKYLRLFFAKPQTNLFPDCRGKLNKHAFLWNQSQGRDTSRAHPDSSLGAGRNARKLMLTSLPEGRSSQEMVSSEVMFVRHHTPVTS